MARIDGSRTAGGDLVARAAGVTTRGAALLLLLASCSAQEWRMGDDGTVYGENTAVVHADWGIVERTQISHDGTAIAVRLASCLRPPGGVAHVGTLEELTAFTEHPGEAELVDDTLVTTGNGQVVDCATDLLVPALGSSYAEGQVVAIPGGLPNAG